MVSKNAQSRSQKTFYEFIKIHVELKAEVKTVGGNMGRIF